MPTSSCCAAIVTSRGVGEGQQCDAELRETRGGGKMSSVVFSFVCTCVYCCILLVVCVCVSHLLRAIAAVLWLLSSSIFSGGWVQECCRTSKVLTMVCLTMVCLTMECLTMECFDC